MSDRHLTTQNKVEMQQEAVDGLGQTFLGAGEP